jgi:hypothetical protein
MRAELLIAVAGLAYVDGCATPDPSGPATESASSPLNASPSTSAGTQVPTGSERSFGASCTAYDTGVGRDVVITAFGYKGTMPTYLATFDVYDDGSVAKWVASGTVQDAGPAHVATAAAYVAAVTDPAINDGNAAHLTTCYFAGGYNGTVQKQVWKATVANGTPTWTKMTDMNVARAKFGFSWGGTTTKTLIAVGGGFGATRTNTIETFDRATPGTWTTETATLDQAVHSFGFRKISDTKFVTSGGDGATDSPNPSAHINAIKVNASGRVDSVGDILNGGGNTVIVARQDNIVVPTGKTGLGGTDRVEIMVAMGEDNSSGSPVLVTTTRKVVIEWSSPPSYVSDAAGSAPSSNAAFPSVVDAYVSPNDATSNPGYIVISGINAASPQAPVNAIMKWNPSTTGGSWGTSTMFAAQNRCGVNAVYVKSIDKVIASSGTDRYPASASSTDYRNVDVIQ